MLWLPCSVSSLLAHPILGFCVGQNQFVEDLIPCPIVPVESFLSRLREREGLNWRVLHMDGHLEWTFTYTMILHVFILYIFMEHPQGARLWYWINLTKTLTLWSEDSQGEPDHGWVNKDGKALFLFSFFFFLPHHAACGILVPWPGIKHIPPALKVWSLNHRTSREFPKMIHFNTASNNWIHSPY